MPRNWRAREAKLDKRRNGMLVSGRSLLTVTLPTIVKKGEQAKAERLENEKKLLVKRGKKK